MKFITKKINSVFNTVFETEAFINDKFVGKFTSVYNSVKHTVELLSADKTLKNNKDFIDYFPVFKSDLYSKYPEFDYTEIYITQRDVWDYRTGWDGWDSDAKFI